MGPDHRKTRLDVGHGGIGSGLVEHHGTDAVLGQEGGKPAHHANLAQDLVGDDERLAIAMSLDIRCRFLQAARPHQVDCGNVELECRHDGLRMVSH